jgi:type II secretory pathway pseudopilin PulG
MLAIGEIMKKRKTTGQSKNQGFSLIELTFAMFILTVGVLGGMTMIIMGMTRNNTNRVDTTATNAAQTVMEAIAGQPANNGSILVGLTDCLGNQMSINTTAGAAPNGTGATLMPNNIDIDFGQPIMAGYQMNWTICNNNSANKNGLQKVYDVRWHITAVGSGNFGKLVIVSAHQPFVPGSKGIGFIAPVTLRTIVGL